MAKTSRKIFLVALLASLTCGPSCFSFGQDLLRDTLRSNANIKAAEDARKKAAAAMRKYERKRRSDIKKAKNNGQGRPETVVSVTHGDRFKSKSSYKEGVVLERELFGVKRATDHAPSRDHLSSLINKKTVTCTWMGGKWHKVHLADSSATKGSDITALMLLSGHVEVDEREFSKHEELVFEEIDNYISIISQIPDVEIDRWEQGYIWASFDAVSYDVYSHSKIKDNRNRKQQAIEAAIMRRDQHLKEMSAYKQQLLAFQQKAPDVIK